VNTRIFLRVLWAIFALAAPFAISHPFGLIGGPASFTAKDGFGRDFASFV